MSEPALSTAADRATLEILWQDDAGACLLVREPDGALSAGALDVGLPAVVDVVHAGRTAPGS